MAVTIVGTHMAVGGLKLRSGVPDPGVRPPIGLPIGAGIGRRSTARAEAWAVSPLPEDPGHINAKHKNRLVYIEPMVTP